jgi:hypothetical protein
MMTLFSPSFDVRHKYQDQLLLFIEVKMFCTSSTFIIAYSIFDILVTKSCCSIYALTGPTRHPERNVWSGGAAV